MDICDFLYQKYTVSKENEHHFDMNEMRLTRKEENGKKYNRINLNYFIFRN
jgi:hypothetical protein